MKKIRMLFSIAIMLIGMTACGKEESIANQNGSIADQNGSIADQSDVADSDELTDLVDSNNDTEETGMVL